MPARLAFVINGQTAQWSRILMPYRIIATATDDYPIDVESFRAGLGGIASVEVLALPYGTMTRGDEDEAIANLAPADGLFVRIGYVSKRVIDNLPRLRVITLHGVGVDQVDVTAARERGIVITNVPGANAQAVAELTIALMLAVLRRLTVADSRLRAGDWAGGRQMGEELSGKTLGLVGLGNIGKRVAVLGTAFGMRVIAHTRHTGDMPPGVSPSELPTLLKASDVVSLHVPLTTETDGLIDAARLALMKPTAILVNTARGQLVNEAALASALRSGQIAGAGLDVHSQEPPDPASPLLGLDNVVLTPHIGSSTSGALRNIASRAGEDMARVLQGAVPLHPVT